MRLSRFFLPILKENPKEAEIVSHRLMLRAGMVRQTSAGIYAWLPLGLRVKAKIEGIIRDEMANMVWAIEQQVRVPTGQIADFQGAGEEYDRVALQDVAKNVERARYAGVLGINSQKVARIAWKLMVTVGPRWLSVCQTR